MKKCNKLITIRRYRYAYLWMEYGRKCYSLEQIFKIMIAKQFQSSYNEGGNKLATENQRAKIIYATEIK